MDLISVIVPVYNVEKYLDRCIESIVSQTYQNLEIILVDDGSTDNCAQICDVWEKKDHRIRAIHKQNGGVGSARNIGMEIMTGEYVMFVDPDDYISRDAVEVLYQRMQKDGSDMAIGKHTDVYENGITNGRFCQWMTDGILSPAELFLLQGEENYCPVSAWAKLYRRNVISGIYYPELTCGEDLWVFPLVVERCQIISIVDHVLYFYSQRVDSIVHTLSDKKIIDTINADLHLVQFVWRCGIQKTAYRWYAIAIEKALLLKKRVDGIEVFYQYFAVEERRAMMKCQKIKTKIKWICLHSSVLYTAFRIQKKVRKK